MKQMKKYLKYFVFNAGLFIFLVCFACVQDVKAAKPLEAYCGSAALRQAFINLGKDGQGQGCILELKKSAEAKRGFNSLLEIKQAAQKAGYYVKAFKSGYNELKKLKSQGQLIANITGNRHFCLIEKVSDEEVDVYIPGINAERLSIPAMEFTDFWDKVALLVSKEKVDFNKLRIKAKIVSDEYIANVIGAGSCGNTSGSSFSANGSDGTVRGTTGNGAGKSSTDSADSRSSANTREPVVIHNGNLFLETEDISVPARGLPLKLDRNYNAEIVSEVSGWLPELGAGSWVIEKGEYSGQGNRSTSEVTASDIVFETDMQTVQPGANSSWETGWINIRYQENSQDQRKAYNCYYFLMHTNGKIELAKWKNGVQYFLYNKYTAYRPVNKNRIKIEAIGSNIKVYINGTLEINYTDSNPVLIAGRVALESYFSHSHFDNAKITAGGQIYTYDFNTDDNEFIFGYGWTHSYFLKIKEYPNHLTLFRENNSKEIYVPNGDGTYTGAPFSYYAKLNKDASGFSLKNKRGVHYRFGLNGRLQYIEDRNLNRMSLTYSLVNGKTLLTRITEPAGRFIALQYGANNMVVKAIDPAGNVVQYVYDAANHLIQALDRNGNTTNYAYDPITHNLIEIKDPENNSFRYTFIYNDRVNDQTDPLGQKTTFDYLWSTVHVINNRGEIYKYNFDAKEYLQSVVGPNNVMARTVNDANGNILESYDKKSNKTVFTYDSLGNNTSVTDALLNKTTFTYETLFNQPKTITDPKGNVTAFSYDSKGNLTQAINAEGAVSTNTYNSSGQVILSVDPKGNAESFTYDLYGNLATKKDPQNNITSYTYDILGRLTKSIDALNNTTEFSYDKNGNLLSVKDPLGNITSYAYTKNDKVAVVTDPLGNTTSYTYDCFGNLLTVIDAQSNLTTYTYDTVNQMHLDKANLLSVTDAKGNKITYVYDSLDRLITQTDALNRAYQFSYDNQGNLTKRTDSNGKAVNYTYNVLNLLSQVIYPDSTSVNYTYDKTGNITAIQDTTGTTLFTFDKINRLKSKTYPDSIALNYTYDLNNNRVSLDLTGYGQILYEYDTLDRLNKITTPDSKVTRLAYDQVSRRSQLNYPNGAVTTYAYDNANRLTFLVNKDKNLQAISSFNYAYDKSSRKLATTFINGSANYAYDSLNQLLKESGTLDNQAFAINYGYDKLGNRLKETEGNKITTYSYNALNQLIQSSGYNKKLISVSGSVADANPVNVRVNNISATVTGAAFTANNVALIQGTNTINAKATDAAGNIGTKSISVTYNPAIVPVNYVYDNNGSLVSKTQGATTESFAYDFENRIKTFTAQGQSATYVYSGLGERISKTVNGVTTKYYYAADELILEKTTTNSIYYIHGPSVDELFSDSRGYFYHTDGLGSVVNLTNSAGLKADSYSYSAFGIQRTGQSANRLTAFQYTGRQYDSESGLYFYRNRYYDTKIGRFITRDPIGIAGGMNLYAYVENNSVNLVDPWGWCGSGRGRLDDFLDWLSSSEGFFNSISMNPAADGMPQIPLDQGVGIIGIGMVKGAKAVQTSKYWQYFTKGWKNFKSPWFVKGINGKPPYKLGKEAREVLNLPKANRGTAVQPYKPKKIVGPRHPKPQPDWDPPINKQGDGWEYYDGSSFPD